MPNNPISPQPKARGRQLCPESTAALCSFKHPLLPTSMHSCVSMYNELRATLSFYSEGIGSPITLSSFLQLNTDQLMTTNETLRDFHTGILEWCWEKEERWEMDNKRWVATHSKCNSREALSQSRPYWYLLKLATQAKVAGLIYTIYFTLISRCHRGMSWDSNSNQSNQSGTQCLVLPGPYFTSPGKEKE